MIQHCTVKFRIIYPIEYFEKYRLKYFAKFAGKYLEWSPIFGKIQMHVCVQGIRNVRFSEDFAYLVNG